MRYPRLFQLFICLVAIAGCTGFEEMPNPNDYIVNCISMQEVAVQSNTLDIPFSARLDVGSSTKGKAGFMYSKDSNMSSPTELKAERSGNTLTANELLKDYGRTYYVKAYFKNGRSQIESDISSFSLLPFTGYVSVSTPSVSSVSSTTAAVSSSFVAATGVELDSYRFEISKTDNPFTALSSTEAKVTNNLINTTFKDLEPGKAYYIRARVSETSNSSYSEILEITTSTSLASWGTPAVSNITSSSARVTCKLTSEGGLSISEVGVVYSTSKSPTTNSSKIIAEKTEVGDYSFDLSSLDPGKTYYVRCYAINEKGTAYSSEVSFNSAIRLATVTTSVISSVSAYSATAGGEVTSDGGSAVTERGVVWSEYSNPTISTASKKTSGTGTGKYECQITSLTPGKTYYVRAYATNAKGTAYGEEKSFSTTTTVPTVATSSVTNITGNSATCGGNVTADGGVSVTARGVVWSTSPNPTVNLQTKTVNGSGTGSFTSSITGLKTGTTYYVRAYATNAKGTSYGSESTFSTIDYPTVTTSSVSQITGNSAVCGGNVTADGGASVTARGVVWSTKSNPTVDLLTKTVDGTGSGAYTSSMTGLETGTKYYVRAYATNMLDTSYGEEISFTTPELPTVITSSVINITNNSAVCGFSITADGGTTLTACGVVWSTEPNPTVDLNSRTKTSAHVTDYYHTITGLEPGTKYYVRAYATNTVGISYGEELSFTTSTVAPTVLTSSVSQITSDSAVCGGNVTADGGSPVTSRGLIMTTQPNPNPNYLLSSNRCLYSPAGTGAYTINITGLAPGTTYYVRAFAKNSEDISYGEEISFTTDYCVDLGLSVKWRSCNLGANTPEEYGLYYQWGDTQGYGPDASDGKYFGWTDSYDRVSYKFYKKTISNNGTDYTITKYNLDDKKKTLEMEDDAARVSLGGNWRMPSIDEWLELMNSDNCTWTRTSINGVDGYMVKSLKTGFTNNWIFLPTSSSRYKDSSNSHHYLNDYGSYWSSTLTYASIREANSVRIEPENSIITREYPERVKGLTIRPVCE